MIEIPDWVNELLDQIMPWWDPDKELKDGAPEEVRIAFERVREFMAPMEGTMQRELRNVPG